MVIEKTKKLKESLEDFYVNKRMNLILKSTGNQQDNKDMESLKRIYDINRDRLNALSIPFREWQHEAILDFDTDIRVASELGWTGTHTKSLFLKLKGQGYAIYLTEKDSRLDAKQIKAVTGKRPSICDDDEIIRMLTSLGQFSSYLMNQSSSQD